jgi:hypothetical protein
MDASSPMHGLLGRRPPLKISNSGVVFGRQFSLFKIGIRPELAGAWIDSEMVPAGLLLNLTLTAGGFRHLCCKEHPMEKAINRTEGRASRTTDDEFARDGFLRERVMMPSERHCRRAAKALFAKPLLRENSLPSLAFSLRKVDTSVPVFRCHTQLSLLGGV